MKRSNRKIERTPCECSAPGWCEKHKCYKSKHQWELCQTSVAYYNNWQRNTDKRGKILNKREREKRIPKERIQKGVGKTIRRWLSRVGVKPNSHCNCYHLANEMDVKGVDYVEMHLEEYVRKMEASIKMWRKGKLLIPQPPKWAVEKLIKWAIASVRNETTEEFGDIQV